MTPTRPPNPVDATAARHGASVAETTSDPAVAYAGTATFTDGPAPPLPPLG